MIENFKCFLNDGYKGISQVRTNYPHEYSNIINFNKNFSEISWGQKLYNYVNNIKTHPTCICGKSIKFYKFGRGYATYCSNNCKYSDERVNEKRKETYLKRYGVENPLQSKEIQEKRKQNFLDKYGVEHQSQLREVKEKRKQTNLDKYGVTTNLLHEDTIEKSRLTKLKRYGVEHQSQSELIKHKKIQTNRKKWGVDYNFQSEINKEKTKKTNLKKYGVEHTGQSKIIREKQSITRKKNNKLKYTKLLNIGVKNIITNDNGELTIKNYCKKHNEFNISYSLLHQRWFKYDKKICTKCYPINKHDSANEIEICDFIKDLHGLNVINNIKQILKKRFELDVYIKNKNIAIEHDGIYWHSVLFKNKNYHKNKTDECEKLGIQLIHVFEDEWIYKKQIVKSIIKSKLDLINNEIDVTNCQIKEIRDVNLVKTFLNKNHIHGYLNSDINIGLYYKKELISLMTFNDVYEMLRYCNRLNTNVTGGANKLLNYFINQYNPKIITTFPDRRYSNGKEYKQLGFKHIENTKPNCWYFKKNELIRYHESKFRKNDMNERGFLRIYDSGNMKFELNL